MDEPIDGHFAVGEGFQDAAALGLGDGVEGVEGGWGSGHGFDLCGNYIPIWEYVKSPFSIFFKRE